MLPGAGRVAATICTREPGRIVRPMDEPEASTQSGRDRPAADRRVAAITAGSIVDISGVPVLVQAGDAQRAAVLAAAIGRLPLHRGPAEARVAFGPDLPRLPEDPPDESY